MREDMSRVIVERPRLGGGRTRKGRARASDDLPKQEGMRRPHLRSGDWKTLNENLAPLRRYLERQVGRPWNEVYSEIARHLCADSTVQQHVRDHLSDFVAVKPRRTSGRSYLAGGGTEHWDRLWYQRLYVDPKDGLLKRTDRLPEARTLRRARRRKPELPDRIALAGDRELRRIDGLWYEVTLAPLPEPEYRAFDEVRRVALKRYARTSPMIEVEIKVRRLVTPAIKDAVNGTAVPAGPDIDDERSWAEYRRAHPDRRFAVGKRTMSRTELKRHGLRNLPPEE
jgi:hypothetical protein